MTLLEERTPLLRVGEEATAAPVWSPRARLLTATGLPVLLILGWVLGSLGLHEKSVLCYTVFLSLAPGVAGALVARVDTAYQFWLYSGVGGATVLVLVSLPMAWTGWWRVQPMALLIGGGSMLVAGWTVYRDRADWGEWLLRPLRTQPTSDTGPDNDLDAGSDAGLGTVGRRVVALNRRLAQTWLSPSLLAVIGAGLAMLAAHLHTGDPNPWGMALSAGPLWFVGAAVALWAFGLAWSAGAPLMVPSVTAGVLVVLCQAVMYREPTVIPAARHIGIAEFVIANGGLEPGHDIYQSWSGLFTAAAFTKEAVGLGSLFGYATWWAVAAAALSLLAMRAVAGHFLGDRRAWLAAVVFGLGSSLNTSFFAPQVFGLVVALTMSALFLALESAVREQREGRPTGLPVWRRLLSRRLLPRLLVPRLLVPRLLVPRLLVLGAMASALATVHQLSPYLLVLAMATLIACRRLRPWWTLLVPLVPALWWAAVNLEVMGRYIAADAFGRLFDNLQPPIHPPATLEMALANKLTFQVPALALVVIGLLALLTLLTSRTRVNLALLLTAGSPVVLMLGTNYGNEGIFRVVLFALPWLAILACRLGIERTAPPAVSPVSGPPAGRRRALVLLSVVALFGVNVVGLTGMDWTRVLRHSDVASLQWFETTAPPDSTVLSLGTNLATPMSATARYDDVNYVAREILLGGQHRIYPAEHGDGYDPVADLNELTIAFAAAHPSGPRFLLATETNAAFDQRYGQQRISDQERMAAAADRSVSWQRIHHNGGVTIWRYTGQPS